MATISKLSQEIQDISRKKTCKTKDGEYSSSPIEGVDNDSSGFPFIDQVIYREWNENIIFKDTSTVFHRVDGRIFFYKSKQENNVGNPIYIDGEINDEWWEKIGDCCEGKVFTKEFTYLGGEQTFQLDFDTVKENISVYVNGQGALSEKDYSVNGKTVTILPPNVLSIGSEVIIKGNYGDDVQAFPITSFEHTWLFGDNNVIQAPYFITDLISVQINGVGYPKNIVIFSYGTDTLTINEDVFPIVDPGIGWRFTFIVASSEEEPPPVAQGIFDETFDETFE